MAQVRRVLNVGGHDKRIELPPQYAGFEQILLDVDPTVTPDILCDARELSKLEPRQFDAVYCAHNLEHYYRHEVPSVLALERPDRPQRAGVLRPQDRFTERSLVASIQRSGFGKTYSTTGNLEVNVLAFRRMPDALTKVLFGLPDA
jgi:hypothetical protein